jgi:hypothetical protein
MQVIFNRTQNEHGLLRYVPYGLSEGPQFNILNVHLIEVDLTSEWSIEPFDHLDDRALSGAAGADYGSGLAASDGEIHVL